MQWKFSRIYGLRQSYTKKRPIKIAHGHKPLLNCSRLILPKPFQMKSYPIHENLDTSFINLSALIKYLRRQYFNGRISVEFGDYEAEIVLLEDGSGLTIREHDRVSGRVGEGEEALQRLLIRARQSGGIVNVYRQLAENPAVINANGNSVEEHTVSTEPPPVSQTGLKTPDRSANPAEPEFPFRLSNNVENRARQNILAPDDWQTLLDLTGELLGTIDRTLAGEGLNFKTAFQKASAEIAGDYPFLHQGKAIAHYTEGKFTMKEQTGAAIFVGGIMEILRRIMEKLGANPKFAEIYRQTVQEILAQMRKNKSLYDKFSITAPLEKIIGA